MTNSIAKLEKAFRREPDAPLFARLADLYLDKGRTERALSLCEEGCANFPDYSTGFVVLSKCYEKQGEVEKAREAMGHALRLDPENPGSYKRLSRLFQQLGVAPLALQSLQQATHLDPFDESIEEQIDQLTYADRKEATEDSPAAEVVSLTEEPDTSPAIESSVEPLIAGAPEDGSVNEVAVSGTPPIPNDGRSDAIAALGFEIFGGKMPEATEAPPDEPDAGMPVESDETVSNWTDISFQTSPTTSRDDLDSATAAVPPVADDQDSPDGEETGILGDKEASTLFLVPDPSPTEAISAAKDEEAAPQVNSLIHFTEKKETDAEEAPNEVSIFSPDVLPEDSDIFRSQQSPDFVLLPTAEENTSISAEHEDPVESAPTADERAESPIAEAKAEAQEATETPTAEARTETQTLFLTTKLSEETTPAPRQETDSRESNLPASDVSTTEHDAAEEQTTLPAALATEISAAADEQSGEIPDSASSKVSETESAPLENSEAFADPAYADDSTTGTPTFFLSSSEADATDGPIESPSDSPATELTDTAPRADDPSVGQSNPELLRLFREIESEPEIGAELEIGAERKPVTPPPALKPGHPEDKFI